MKTLSLLVIAFLITSIAKSPITLAQSYYNGSFSEYPGFEELPSDRQEQKNYFQARKKAIELIRMAAATDKFNETQKAASKLAIDKLLVSKIYVSTNPFNPSCQNKTEAYVDQNIPDKIFVCNLIREKMAKDSPTQEDFEYTAQVLAHESIHLLGTDDECIASKFEYMVMQNSLGRADHGSLNTHRDHCPDLNNYKNIAQLKKGSSPSKKTATRGGASTRASYK